MRNYDYRLNLCLIREAQSDRSLEQEARYELLDLFLGKGTCYLEGRVEDDLEIILAEIQGTNQFSSEEQVLDYVSDYGSEKLISWIQGYHVLIEPKTERCACSLGT